MRLYRAFATVSRALEGRRLESRLDLGKGIIAYRFAGEAGSPGVLVLWSTDADRTVAVPAAGPAVLVDLMGNRDRLPPAKGNVSVRLQRGAPVFLPLGGAPPG